MSKSDYTVVCEDVDDEDEKGLDADFLPPFKEVVVRRGTSIFHGMYSGCSGVHSRSLFAIAKSETK